MTVTINDFVRYRELKKESERLARQIHNLEKSDAREITDVVSGSMNHFPYSNVHYQVVGLLHNTNRIEDKKREFEMLRRNAKELLDELSAFLATVKDTEVRETLELYYIDGLRYCDIPEKMGLYGDGSVQMKKAHRYMRSKMDVKTENE